MEDFFRLWGGSKKSVNDPAFTDMNELTNPANFSKARNSKYNPDKPTFETNDLAGRVRKYLSGGYAGEPYTNFYRRDFLIREQVTFPNVYVVHDQIFAFQGMCLAKKILRVPNICYIVRPREGSIMREQLQPPAEFHKSLRIYIDGFNALAKIMDKIKFFGEHPDYRYAVLDWFVQTKLNRLQKFYENIPAAALNPLVEREFHSEEAAFAAYLFNTVSRQRLQIMSMQAQLDALKKILIRK